MESASSWQAQTDSFLASYNVRVCGNDYLSQGVQVQVVRNLFARPTTSNPDPRPVFAAINCISNSPTHQYRQVLINEFYNGGGAQDFSARIAAWRTVIDAVEAPPPRITDIHLQNSDTVQFTVPGQRGRTNRIEGSSELLTWTTITNITGVNGPVAVRDTNVLTSRQRFYRIRRL